MLAGAPSLTVDESGTFHLDGVQVALPCIVQGASGGRLRLIVRLNASQAQEFAPWPARLATAQAA